MKKFTAPRSNQCEVKYENRKRIAMHNKRKKKGNPGEMTGARVVDNRS